MPQKKTSKKLEFSFKNMPLVQLKNKSNISEFNPSVRLKNSEIVAQALWQCLVENDIDAFKEILRSHLEVLNKDDLAKKAGIPRRTLFRMLSPEGNPTLENLGKIIHQLCA
jgi:probable addiction module antidote protein